MRIHEVSFWQLKIFYVVILNSGKETRQVVISEAHRISKSPPDANFSEIQSGASSSSKLSWSLTSPINTIKIRSKKLQKNGSSCTILTSSGKRMGSVSLLLLSTISEWLEIILCISSSFVITERLIDWNRKWIMLKILGRHAIISRRFFACEMAGSRSSIATLSFSLICK